MKTEALQGVPKELKEKAEKIKGSLINARTEGLAGLNVAEIQRQTGLSRYSTQNTLTAMETSGIVRMQKVGNARLYTINSKEG